MNKKKLKRKFSSWLKTFFQELIAFWKAFLYTRKAVHKAAEFALFDQEVSLLDSS